jgi:stage II sporulation protein GA (sporulation sigma-E factor processing peptidase)
VIEYADLFFLVNLLADYVLLCLTGRLRRLRCTSIRLLAAACMGSLYGMLLLIWPEWSLLTAGFIKLVVALLMVRIAFAIDSLQAYLRNCATFMLCTVLIGGFMLTAKSLFAIGTMGLIVSTGLFLCSALAVLLMERYAQREKTVQALVFPVSIVIDENIICCRGLLDTGNHLCDPLSGKPVSVTQWDVWREVLPGHMLTALQNGNMQRLMELFDENEFHWHHRLTLIPYRTVGSAEHAMLAALRVDRVVLECEHGPKEVERALIAINPGALSHDQRYQAIIHPSFLY